MMERRVFLASLAATKGLTNSLYAQHEPSRANRPILCIFSKHLAEYNYDDLAKVARDLGFQGIDLTVRPGGHVLPENVQRDLPRAVEAIRKAGLSVPMITTALTSPEDPTARPILATAAQLNVPLIKLGYWRYRNVDVLATVASVKKDVQGLVQLASTYGLTFGFHNHSGNYVGAPVWDAYLIIRDLPENRIGYYFDPGHATAEGGVEGWRISLNLVRGRLKMVAVKDFVWVKEGSRWRHRWCPLGHGAVQWEEVFRTIAATGFNGPISLHLEYEPENKLQAIRQDLEFLQRQVQAAYGT